jgi:Protein of unknown function (DUF4256)
LKARFEKHAKRHQGLEWATVQARLQGNTGKLWSLNEMEITGGEPMWWVTIKRPANSFFMIVQRKVLKVSEVFVTTGKHWNQLDQGRIAEEGTRAIV